MSHQNRHKSTREQVPLHRLRSAEEVLPNAEATVNPLMTSNTVMRLQRTVGNQAVLRMLGRDEKVRGEEQSDATSAPASLTVSAAPGQVQRMTELGQFEVNNYKLYGSKTFPLIVRTTEEWKKKLENMDDEDDYTSNLAAFLWLAKDPMILKKKQHRLGDLFITVPQRAPTDEEKMDFVRALYTTGKKLDLPDKFGVFDDETYGAYVPDLRMGLAALISEYTPRVIAEVGNQAIDRKGVTELAKEGGGEARGAMIESAAATAYKGVDLYMTATTIVDNREREVEKMRASETIRNSGRVIKIALEQHKASFKAHQAWTESMLGKVFDQLWGLVPGGGLISGTAKAILADGFKASFTELVDLNDPSERIDAMADNFVNHVNKLVEKPDAFTGTVLTATDANAIINGFEAVRG